MSDNAAGRRPEAFRPTPEKSVQPSGVFIAAVAPAAPPERGPVEHHRSCITGLRIILTHQCEGIDMSLPHMPRHVRGTVRCLTMAAVSTAALLAAIPAANASSPTDAAASARAGTTGRSSVSRSFTLPKGTTRATLSLGASKAEVVKAPQDTITCVLTVYSPWFTFVGGTPRIATQAETTCSSWVTSLSIAAELTRNGATASVGDNQNNFSSSISVDTAAPCAEGSWVAHADGDIIYPPLFWPPSADLSVQSRALPVSICRN
ncbi:conserved hypothetical protein [Streptomyces scabiei 87.22]|uniref:Uncharacterized protein n=1 Tax=Streptomyces scabiei (strain 87.22) TaxID=680198 RepID=C9YZ86_STRSW|nr:conserved hypothetical protein [Streptomyces scabiei 87.22]